MEPVLHDGLTLGALISANQAAGVSKEEFRAALTERYGVSRIRKEDFGKRLGQLAEEYAPRTEPFPEEQAQAALAISQGLMREGLRRPAPQTQPPFEAPPLGPLSGGATPDTTRPGPAESAGWERARAAAQPFHPRAEGYIPMGPQEGTVETGVASRFGDSVPRPEGTMEAGLRATVTLSNMVAKAVGDAAQVLDDEFGRNRERSRRNRRAGRSLTEIRRGADAPMEGAEAEAYVEELRALAVDQKKAIKKAVARGAKYRAAGRDFEAGKAWGKAGDDVVEVWEAFKTLPDVAPQAIEWLTGGDLGDLPEGERLLMLADRGKKVGADADLALLYGTIAEDPAGFAEDDPLAAGAIVAPVLTKMAKLAGLATKAGTLAGLEKVAKWGVGGRRGRFAKAERGKPMLNEAAAAAEAEAALAATPDELLAKPAQPVTGPAPPPVDPAAPPIEYADELLDEAMAVRRGEGAQDVPLTRSEAARIDARIDAFEARMLSGASPGARASAAAVSAKRKARRAARQTPPAYGDVASGAFARRQAAEEMSTPFLAEKIPPTPMPTLAPLAGPFTRGPKPQPKPKFATKAEAQAYYDRKTGKAPAKTYTSTRRGPDGKWTTVTKEGSPISPKRMPGEAQRARRDANLKQFRERRQAEIDAGVAELTARVKAIRAKRRQEAPRVDPLAGPFTLRKKPKPPPKYTKEFAEEFLRERVPDIAPPPVVDPGAGELLGLAVSNETGSAMLSIKEAGRRFGDMPESAKGALHHTGVLGSAGPTAAFGSGKWGYEGAKAVRRAMGGAAAALYAYAVQPASIIDRGTGQVVWQGGWQRLAKLAEVPGRTPDGPSSEVLALTASEALQAAGHEVHTLTSKWLMQLVQMKQALEPAFKAAAFLHGAPSRFKPKARAAFRKEWEGRLIRAIEMEKGSSERAAAVNALGEGAEDAIRAYDQITEDSRKFIIETRRYLGVDTPDDWGITETGYFHHDFIRHLITGEVKLKHSGLPDGEKTFSSYAEALAEAGKLGDDPGMSIELDPSRIPALSSGKTWLTKRDYKRVIGASGKAARKARGKTPGSRAAVIDAKTISRDLGRDIGPHERKKKHLGATHERKGLEGYEKDFFRVMSGYFSEVARTQALSKMQRRIQPIIEQLGESPHVVDRRLSKLIASRRDHVWGKPTPAEELFGIFVEGLQGLAVATHGGAAKIPRVGPAISKVTAPLAEWGMGSSSLFAGRQLANYLTAFHYHTKLRFNPKSAYVNMTQPLITLQGHVSAKDLANLYYTVSTDSSVRKMIDDAGVLRGAKKVEGMDDIWRGERSRVSRALKGASLFEASTNVNRSVGYLHGWRTGKAAGLPDEQAHRNGLAWSEVTEFDNTMWNVPAGFAGPFAKVIGQFKPFLFKEVDSLLNLARVKGPRAAGAALIRRGLVGGAGGTALEPTMYGAMVHQWMTDAGMDNKSADHFIETVMYGLPGLFGADVTGSYRFYDGYGQNIAARLVNFALGPTLGFFAGVKDWSAGDRKTVPMVTPYARMGSALWDLLTGDDTRVKVGKRFMKLSPGEALIYGLGFRPKRMSQARARHEERAQRRKAMRPEPGLIDSGAEAAEGFLGLNTIK